MALYKQGEADLLPTLFALSHVLINQAMALYPHTATQFQTIVPFETLVSETICLGLHAT